MSSKTKPYSQTIDVSLDDRGEFVQFLEGLPVKRLYYVYNYGRGVIRGFHLHKHERKYFVAVWGAAKIIALNPKNPREKFTFISSSRKPTLVVIPPGYANGWMSLEEQTVLVCASTSTLKESIKDDQRFDPYKWGDLWQVLGR